MAPTSFISEHSSEYILVPQLIELLARHFTKIVPLYFLLTREGNSMSCECSPSQAVKVVGVFARRPKIGTPEQPFIDVTFNASLFDSAQLASSFGIPTFAGVPLASSIMQLNLKTDCAWFQLLSVNGYATVRMLLDGTVMDWSADPNSLEGPISPADLAARIVEHSNSMEWGQAIEYLRLIRRGTRESFLQPFGGGYHPFHLLLIE